MSRLNATPDVRVRVRRIVITVPIPQTRVRRVVPIPTNGKDRAVDVRVGECAQYPLCFIVAIE